MENQNTTENQEYVSTENNYSNQKPTPTGSNFGNWAKESIVLKGIIIFFLVLILLIPTGSIKRLIYEREQRQDEAIEEVSMKWANGQKIIGPVLSIPTRRTVVDKEGNKTIYQRRLHILPEKLNIDNNVDVVELKRGIFNISAYETRSKITGDFALPNVKAQLLPNETLQLNNATLSFGLSDLRGIQNEIAFSFNDSSYKFRPGPGNDDVIKHGLHTPVNLSTEESMSFEIPLTLKGSSFVNFVPVGRTTQVSINSSWPDPKFYGNFLPDQREVTENGFSATWKVIDLNRNFGQHWFGGKDISYTDFGVEFIQPVDHYSKSIRSVKYANLVICLTFITFFFIEILQKIKIHPIQYIMVGFALVVFYLLLISISEHSNFNTAYLISTFAVTGIITVYLKSVMNNWKQIPVSSGLVLTGYGFIYVTLQDQDYALLIGSIGLFIVLSAIMLLSRKVNWYQSTSK